MDIVACYCTCWTCESGAGHCSRKDLHEAKIQVPACDSCSLGVMDMENPHRLGACRCECHLECTCYPEEIPHMMGCPMYGRKEGR